ncbi:MAG: membrane dipeptidase [Planctomycetota bacterium]
MPPKTTAHPLFDAHLDLAYLAVYGRDMTAPLDPAMTPEPPAAVTLPSLAEGRVRMALGTIFTAPDEDSPVGYPAGDAETAQRRGLAQLEAYRTWQDRKLVKLDLRRWLPGDPGVGQVRGGMGVAELVNDPIPTRLAAQRNDAPLHVGILIENADIIREPAKLSWWVEQGVVAVGMAWWASSRYASGNGADPHDDEGITHLGEQLVAEMDQHLVVHDQSHLSDAATRRLFDLAQGPIMASHSNCRALTGSGNAREDQRHLTDETIRVIVDRGGVIGLNLCHNFIREGGHSKQRITIDHALDHVDHICSIAGNTNHVGIGSDLDGGFSADHIPDGIDTPRDMHRLCEGLSARGWTDEQVAAFAWGNWTRFLSAAFRRKTQ